ncbi:hypothetical protein [Succiniclasticum ruminis]|uniref:Uncharacterized protein n=1 Tax=Succiniclasticum ruminis DSM 9236 TaxID=1123323 RepID=A0A1I1XB63_9FIRM|nr:hypothetical protein [Succiniclasticum ruminis]SFE04391.1 hypothetical protein SAMN05216245_101142 [Succiniclasticum ruminis DSM 9236]
MKTIKILLTAMIISLSFLMGSVYAQEDIEAQWEKNVQQLGAHDEFVTSQLGETRTGVVYFAKCPLKDFKILSLKLEKFEDKPVFLAQTLYTKEVLNPERPLLVKLCLYGSVPNNGFSYTDSEGKTRYYAINASGKDGSLLLIDKIIIKQEH